jgi:RecQ-mediated genome instability protein 1
LQQVDIQLLASDLRDSATPNSGLPINFADLHETRVQETIMVQILSITDIGHSAFNLQNVRQTRIEKADLAGLAGDSDEEDVHDEDARLIPDYPRGMLRFELTDGSQYITAIEYRKIKELKLGETPLGYKVLTFPLFAI